MYAILSHGGRQYRVSAGDRLVVDRLAAEVGSVVGLEPVLLTGGDGDRAAVGADVEGMRVAATVVAHRRGAKLRIFKYKAKKRTRKVAGYRSDLTELRVESILARGAELPAAAGAAQPRPEPEDAGAAAPARGRGRGRPRRAEAAAEPAPTAGAAAQADPQAAAAEVTAPAEAPARRARAPRAPRQSPAAAPAGDPSDGSPDVTESGDGT